MLNYRYFVYQKALLQNNLCEFTTQELKLKGWFFTQKDVLNVFLKVSGIQNKSESKISITKAAKAQT